MIDITSFSTSDLYTLILLPILIFTARVCDVSIGTLRIVFISKGLKYLAPIVGFVEILIWLLAISQIMQNLSNVYYYLFYAGGFAMGNFIGMIVEEKLSIGIIGVRIITRQDANKLVDALRQEKFGMTVVDAEGSKGKVKIIFTVVNRQNIHRVISIVNAYNPRAFYSIEDIRYVSEILPKHMEPWYKRNLRSLYSWRKGK